LEPAPARRRERRVASGEAVVRRTSGLRPGVTFEGDADFPLKGGSVAYFRDRKAAIFVYARRLHPISLLVFRADGLPWPSRNPTRVGGLDALATSERGFNVIVWLRRVLGYTLVFDVDAGVVAALAERMVRAP